MSGGSLLAVLEEYAGKNTARFHMPGHKGRLPPPFDGAALIDFTELRLTGDLYFETDGPIRKSERAMAALFGARDCFYLTGGATQGIYSMLSAAVRPGGRIYADRHSHRCVYNAMALLDLRPVWLWRETAEPWGVPGAFCDLPDIDGPVIYTSPNYYGVITPPPAAKSKTPVLCDAAHGAHLPFCISGYRPPGSLWTVSAHKTLGALGQTALLLSDGTADACLLREQTALFGTASPSFVMLASLDQARISLESGGRSAWDRVARFSGALASKDGRILPCGDPGKLTVYTGNGRQDSERLEREFGVVCEMSDPRNLVFMLSPHNSDEDFKRLEQALASLPYRRPSPSGAAALRAEPPDAVMTPREAFFAPRERVALRDAAGRVAARVCAPSPPGTPFTAPGERFDKIHVAILRETCYNDEYPVWVCK